MRNIISQEEKNRIDAICQEYNITNYTINPNGSIDVNGDVDLTYKRLSKLPIKFNKVSGYFRCTGNKLTSLEHCPKEVGENFNCSHNLLTSLEHCPKSVSGFFYCHFNKLTSLEHCTKEVGKNFSCFDNKLPDPFYTLKNKLTHEEIRIFLKYQAEFMIWHDGFDEEACKELIDEIKTGLL